MTIKTSATSAEEALFMAIGRRASRDHGLTAVHIALDIAACHLNGCPLRLEELLSAETFDFVHDVVGISKHIDRETGKLDAEFTPRFADTLDKAAEEGRTVVATDYMGDLATLWCTRADHLGLTGVPAAKDALAFFSGAASYAAATGGNEEPKNLGTFCALIRQAGVRPVYELRDMTALRRQPATGGVQ